MNAYLDWKLCTNEKEKYQAYLCSSEWWAIRNKVTDRCGGTCEKCKIRKVENVHHLTYIRKYQEQLSDLIGLCKKCHDDIHKPQLQQCVSQVRQNTKLSPIEIELFMIAFNDRELLPEVLEVASKFDLLRESGARNAFNAAMDTNATDSYSKMRQQTAVEMLRFTKVSPRERLRLVVDRLGKSFRATTVQNQIEFLSTPRHTEEEKLALVDAVLKAARERQSKR
jgi:hypothetical protein